MIYSCIYFCHYCISGSHGLRPLHWYAGLKTHNVMIIMFILDLYSYSYFNNFCHLRPLLPHVPWTHLEFSVPAPPTLPSTAIDDVAGLRFLWQTIWTQCQHFQQDHICMYKHHKYCMV